MIPAAFDYVRASSLAAAAAALREHGEDAKVIAGGHSLIPLMRLRFATPAVLVDIAHIDGMSYVRRDGDRLRIGALTTHRQVHDSPDVRVALPLLATAAGTIGDPQIRNRGTIGGVVAHADPAAEYATLCLMLDADIVTTQRTIAARDFFLGLYTTALAEDELVVEVAFPVAPGPSAYVKFAKRLYEWALVGALAQQLDGGWRLGLTSMSDTPVRSVAAEQALAGGASVQEASRLAADGLTPTPTARASVDYKLHLAQVLTAQAVTEAQGTLPG